MAPKIERPKRRAGVLSTLDVVIEALSLPKDACGTVPPAQIALASAVALLDIIRVFHGWILSLASGTTEKPRSPVFRNTLQPQLQGHLPNLHPLFLTSLWKWPSPISSTTFNLSKLARSPAIPGTSPPSHVSIVPLCPPGSERVILSRFRTGTRWVSYPS